MPGLARLIVATAAVALGAGPAAAGSEREPGADRAPQGCTSLIYNSDLPLVINAPGKYCLAEHLVFQTLDPHAPAITVNADGVEIHLAGKTLSAYFHQYGVGIYAPSRKNVTIRKGRLRVFNYGVLIADALGRSEGHLVEQLKVQHCHVGLSVTGAASTIRNNSVVVSFGSSAGPTKAYAVGISQAGSNSTVRDNRVLQTIATQWGGYAAGIDLTHGQNLTVAGNTIAYVTGGRMNYGIRCGAAYAAQNVITGVSTPTSTCLEPPGWPGPYGYPPPNPYWVPYPYPFPYPFSWYESFGSTLSSAGVAALLAGALLLSRKVLTAGA